MSYYVKCFVHILKTFLNVTRLYNPRDFWHFITYFHMIVHDLKTKTLFFTKYKIEFVVPVATKYKISSVPTRFMALFIRNWVKMHWKQAFYILISCITPRFLTFFWCIWGISVLFWYWSRVCEWYVKGVFLVCMGVFLMFENVRLDTK